MLESLLTRTFEFSLPVLATIFLGLFLAGLLLESGLLSSFSSLSQPLVAHARLPEVCASSLVLSMGSTVAANGMIARFHEDELLERREVFLCAMINSIPAYVREIFTYQIPIVLPSLGLVAGGLYASVFMVTALVKVSVVVLLGRMFFGQRSYNLEKPPPTARTPLLAASRRAFRGQARLFFRISIVYLIMTFLIFSFKDAGLFQSPSFGLLAGIVDIPAETIVPLTTYVASPVMGITMLGPMIRGGGVTEVQAMIVLMLGSIFMLPIFALRSMVPNYTALFGARLGLSVVCFSTGISVLVRMAYLLVLLRLG
jgi:hypothetical protein